MKEKRKSSSMTQVKLAQHLKSSQPRVVKMELADPSVTVDLLVRSLYALGAENSEIASVVAEATPGYEVKGKSSRK